MRWLCILLLLANVGYFGWELNQRLYGPLSGEATAAAPPLPVGVPQLRLLSELDRLPPTRDLIANPSSSSTASPSSPTESTSSTESPSPEEATGPNVAAAVEQTKPASESSTAEGTVKPPPAGEPEKPAPTETPVAEPAKPKSAETVASTAEPSKPGSAEAAASPTGTDQCLRLGPFDSEAQAGTLRDRFAGRSRSIAINKSTRQEQKFFWVYLEAVSSDVQAKERLEDLKSKGITDLFMVRKGEMKNAVSLGVFRSQESVRNRLAELKNRGYQPLVVPRYETKTEYWLNLRGDPAQLSVDALADELPVGVKASAVECNVAGGKSDQTGNNPSKASEP